MKVSLLLENFWRAFRELSESFQRDFRKLLESFRNLLKGFKALMKSLWRACFQRIFRGLLESLFWESFQRVFKEPALKSFQRAFRELKGHLNKGMCLCMCPLTVDNHSCLFFPLNIKNSIFVAKIANISSAKAPRNFVAVAESEPTPATLV